MSEAADSDGRGLGVGADEVFRAEIDGHELSAWFRDAVRNRLNAMLAADDAALDTAALGILALTLGVVDDEISDRSCDRCGVYTPPGSTFYTGLHPVDPATLGVMWSQLLAGIQVLVGYGLCAGCAPREFGPLDELGEATS